MDTFPAVTLSDQRLDLRCGWPGLAPQVTSACPDRDPRRPLDALPDPSTRQDGRDLVARGEIGLWTLAAERGRGILADAARLDCRYGFEECGPARIERLAHLADAVSRPAVDTLDFAPGGSCRRVLPVGKRVHGSLGSLVSEDLASEAVR